MMIIKMFVSKWYSIYHRFMMLAMIYNGDDALASEYSIKMHMIENLQGCMVLISVAITVMITKGLFLENAIMCNVIVC